jgi:hypothetical protein
MVKSDAFLFELVDLLEQRAFKRYQQDVQDRFKIRTGETPVCNATFTLKNRTLNGNR